MGGIQIHMSLPYLLECPSPSIYSVLANRGSSSLHLSFAGSGFEAVVCHRRKASQFPESFLRFGIWDCYVFLMKVPYVLSLHFVMRITSKYTVPLVYCYRIVSPNTYSSVNHFFL